MKTVEAVVINWKRPRNVARIVRRLEQQTYPCVITVCDSAPRGFELPHDVLPIIDNHYRIADRGPYSRYVPAEKYRCDYTLFLDDDLLPGIKAIDHFVRWADRKPGAALLGQFGRNVGATYTGTNVVRAADFARVDMVVRAYFVRTKYLPALKRFEEAWGETTIREDDMALACAIRTFTQGGIFLTPRSDDAEERVNAEELPAPHALHDNSDHLRLRTEFWQQARVLAESLRQAAEGGTRSVPAT